MKEIVLSEIADLFNKKRIQIVQREYDLPVCPTCGSIKTKGTGIVRTTAHPGFQQQIVCDNGHWVS